VVFTVLVLLDVLKDGIAAGLEAEEGRGLYILASNCLVAGVVTFYLASAVLYRAPSVALRATEASTTFGALLTLPLAFYLGVALAFGLAASSGKPLSELGKEILFGSIIFMVLLAIYFGLLLFGLYALCGGLALGRLRVKPVALRAAIGLLPLAVIYACFAAALVKMVPSVMTEGATLTATDLSAQTAMVLGWCLGLLLDSGSDRVLDRWQREKSAFTSAGGRF
jgi:hypothetical protein